MMPFRPMQSGQVPQVPPQAAPQAAQAGAPSNALSQIASALQGGSGGPPAALPPQAQGLPGGGIPGGGLPPQAAQQAVQHFGSGQGPYTGDNPFFQRIAQERAQGGHPLANIALRALTGHGRRG